mmetsp:Transcript_81700/g.210345  ORF Transcript_81700/g.210345 Transcript_81700/m.210345 type:complete len:1701 (+) Transcript_81700:95-5197(+)
MANLSAAPAGKDAFFEALSNREGTPPAGAEDDVGGRTSPGADEFGDMGPQIAEEGDSSGEDGYDLNPGVEDPEAFQRFMEASDEESPAETFAEGATAADLQSHLGGEADAYPEAEAPAGGGHEEERRHRGGTHAAPGVIATYRSDAEVKKSLATKRTLKDVEKLRHDYNNHSAAAEDAKSALEDKEQILRELRKQAEAGMLTDPARLSYQEREVSKQWDALTKAEQLRDAAELALHQVTSVHARAHKKHSAENSKSVTHAADRRSNEVKRAVTVVAQEEAAKAAARKREQARLEEAQRKDDEARFHQKLGKQRLAKTQTKHKEVMEEVEKVRESRWQHDAQRVLNLKSSMDEMQRQVQSQNERRRKKQQKVDAERAERQQSLLNDGHNPYEVWRREEMEAKKEGEVAKLKALADLRSEKLLQQLMVEDRAYKKKIEEEKTKRHETEQFQKEMGRYAKEHKVAAYIRKMTIGNVDVLDPTGTALRIDASKVTVQRTHAFGLGRALPDEIDKVDKDMKKAVRKLERMPQFPEEDSQELAAAGGGGPAVTKRPSTMMRSASGAPDTFPQEEDEESSIGSEREPLPDGKLWVPQLTKLEEQYLAAAKERQKQNITSVQRCWGKEFTGDAFLAKPSIIAFNDFEVGKKYRQVIEVTNVSLTFNQFKLLPLDDSVRDFFEIEFAPPGRMSAGVTRYITLWFCPKMSQDMVSTFPILAKTGRIDFPLTCTTKKTILTVTPQDADANPVIDFGQVLSGESATCVLSVKNTGALAAAFTLEPADPENEMVPLVKWTSVKKEFCAHGMTKISFTFVPVATGSFSTTWKLHIDNSGDGDARYVEEKKVLVRGSCLDVPIWVEKEEYDLKTCIFGHNFREIIVVHNRRSVPMKIEVDRPKSIEGQLQINPTVAFVQGNHQQAIQIKFSPKSDFLDRNPQYRDPQRKDVTGSFRIPVRIVGVDQVLPVCTELVGTLTTNNISFEPNIMQLGRCFVGSSAVQRFAIVNESALPQQFCFMRLPSCLSIQDVPTDVLDEEEVFETGVSPVLEGGCDTAIGHLLPYERRQLCITYCPETSTELDCKIQFKAITGALCVRDFVIPCRGQGISPILSLSHPTIDMASIPVDTVSHDSVVITNVSKVPQTMNLLMPPVEHSCIKASPVCCTLQPQESQRLQLEFCPTADYVKFLKKPEDPPAEEGEGGDAAAATPAGSPTPPEGEEEGAAAEGENEEGLSAAEQYRLERVKEIRAYGGRRWEGDEANTIHASWKLAICMRPQVPKGGPVSGNTAAKETQQITYLGIQTCVLPRVLQAEPPIMDFGEVTAQQRVVRTLVLHNIGEGDPQELKMEALPENQCFTVLSAMRTVGNKPCQLTIEFKPQLVQIYQSVLQLRTQSSRVQVPLRGHGVRPVLKIDPEDGILQLGSIVYSKECKDYTTKKLEIKNDSPFELTYALESVVPADPNHVGVPPFTLTPSTGTVEANGTKTVTVTFRPHRPLSVFREKILIKVPNQKVPTFVHLYGHCFRYQIYALPGMDFGPFGRADAKKPGAFVDSLSLGVGAPPSAAPGVFEYPREQQTDISLKFDSGERVKYFLVGAGVPPGTPSAPQNAPAATFDFQIVQSEFSKFFMVEAPEGAKADKVAKGQVQAGAPAIKVAFKYAPEESGSLTYGDVNLDLLSGIGQWITCTVKCVLAGGYVPAGKPPTQEITIELRAYLQQI